MKMDRFTSRVKDVLLSLPRQEDFTAAELFKSLADSTGLSSHLIKTFPNLKFDRLALINLNELLVESYYQAIKLDHVFVGTEHLLLALLKITNSSDIELVRLEIEKLNIFPSALRNFEKSKKTPLLNTFGVNISHKVLKDFDRPLIYRDDYENLISVLLQKDNNNVLLLGDAGVGKKSLISLLARNIAMMETPPSLMGYQIIEIDLLAFMTNSFGRAGDLGIQALIDEIKLMGRVVLSIKNFQNVFFGSNLGFTVPMFYSMFKAAFQQAGIKLIVTMNPTLFDKLVADNEHIFDTFTVIDVEEPDETTTMKILKESSYYIGAYHNVSFEKGVLEEVYKVAKERYKDVKFPLKALNLLDQACSRVVISKTKIPRTYKTLVDKTFLLAQGIDKALEKGDYTEALENRDRLKTMENNLFEMEKKSNNRSKIRMSVKELHIVLDELREPTKVDSSKKDLTFLSKLAEKIKSRIIGQDLAVDAVVRSLIRARLGLRSKKRPMGNFLFLGPTGVGKTELAKVLAEEAFGFNSLIRLDMSDFAEKHTVARLVGAPPGYVGFGEGGELTQKIEQRPESVVLFDEIEKAHPDVLNILLQIMDEGELSDARGNRFDFSKAVVILTSNLGTEIIQNKGIGFDESTLSDKNIEDRLKLNLKKIMKAELLNRFDEIVVFARLKKDDQYKILDVLLAEILKVLNSQNVVLKISNKAKNLLLKKGYSDEYGARALRRNIEKELLDRIAEVLLGVKSRPIKLKTYVTADRLEIKSY